MMRNGLTGKNSSIATLGYKLEDEKVKIFDRLLGSYRLRKTWSEIT